MSNLKHHSLDKKYLNTIVVTILGLLSSLFSRDLPNQQVLGKLTRTEKIIRFIRSLISKEILLNMESNFKTAFDFLE